MARTRGKTNLVEPPAPLIGRDAELAALAAHFDEARRLVTIVGPGGVGKTRLATRFALDHAHAYSAHGGGGSWFVDLTGARGAMEICGSVAAALAVTLDPATHEDAMVAELGRRLARRRRTLLVLDNGEHVARALAAALGEWVGAAPHAHFLVTSRVALGLPAEQLHPLAGLDAPRGRDLFLRCARQLAPELAPGPEDDAAILEIVARVDGLPLAIELAAARARVLSPVALRDRLALGLLVRPGDASRHGSMRSAILDSVAALEPDVRRFFGWCATFAGGFDVEAAEAVLEGADVLGSLEALARHSLLRAFDAGTGERRFALYETIREVAAEQLASDPDASQLAHRHAAHFAALGARRSAHDADDALARELDNLVAAHAHAIATKDGALARSLALALDPLLATRGQSPLRLRLLDATLALADDAAAVAVLLSRGQAHRELGALDAARADFERGHALAEAAGDRAELARAELRLAELDEVGGGTSSARERCARALEHLRDARDRASLACAAEVYAQLGHALRREGELDAAEAHFARADELHRAVSRREGLGAVAYERAVIAIFRGRMALARERLEEGLAHARAAGARSLEGLLESGLGVLAQERGELEAAIAHHTAAVQAFREVGNRHREGSALYYVAATYLERRELAEAHAVLDRAAAAIRSVGAPRYAALIEGARGAAYALADRADDAARAFERADEHAARCLSERSLAVTLAIHRLHLWPLDDDARAAAADALVASAPGDDTRLARRVLEARERAAGRGVWIIRADGHAFRPPGAAQDVDLSRRKPLGRIVHALARRRVDAPGDSLGLDDLLAAAWPGEHIAQRAAINRVHVALSTLRKLGLRDVLSSDERGYLFDPSVALVVE
ncbi:MAG: AAA family ATPase [Sandaracinaceae bacterium]|nr:AAA family ATPase [Sandaracinaceae bacterium]